MKTLIHSIAIAVLFLGLSTSQINAQVYDSTIYEVGHTAGIAFDSSGWSIDVISLTTNYATYETATDSLNLNALLFSVGWFNQNRPFTATCTKAIPEMTNFDDVEISLNFTDLEEPEDSVFLYTSSDFITWNLLGKWGALNETISASRTLTNSDAEYVKLVLNGTVPSSGGTYYFSDFVVKVDGGIHASISDIDLVHHKIYSHDNKIMIQIDNYDEYSVVLYNLSGQELLSETMRGNKVFDLTIPQGVYIVNLTSNGRSYNKKVIIN